MTSAQGRTPFARLDELVVAGDPTGLRAANEAQLNLLDAGLLDPEDVCLWEELLERVDSLPGKPQVHLFQGWIRRWYAPNGERRP